MKSNNNQSAICNKVTQLKSQLVEVYNDILVTIDWRDRDKLIIMYNQLIARLECFGWSAYELPLQSSGGRIRFYQIDLEV